MFSRALAAALVAAALTSTVLAADGAKCGAGTLCPKDSPCCGRTFFSNLALRAC
jgi:hypothetical protein